MEDRRSVKTRRLMMWFSPEIASKGFERCRMGDLVE